MHGDRGKLVRTHARFSLGRHGLRWFLWTSIAMVECRKVKVLCAALNPRPFNCLPPAPFNCVLPGCRKVKYLYDACSFNGVTCCSFVFQTFLMFLMQEGQVPVRRRLLHVPLPRLHAQAPGRRPGGRTRDS